MRRLLLTTAATIAVVSPVGAADLSGDYNYIQDNAPSYGRTVVGDIELGIFWNQIDGLFGDEKSWEAFSGWARANVPLGNRWNILVETGGSAGFNYNTLPNGVSNSSISAFGHVWGGAGGIRYGLFGGATFDEFSIFNSTLASVGGEAEVDIGNATLGAQGFYSWDTSNNCPPGFGCDIYGARGWVDYYFGSNTKLTGTIEWSHGSGILGTDLDVFGGSARLTHRVAGTPVNVFAEGGYWNADFSGLPDADVVRAGGGITIILDGAGGTQERFDKQAPFSFRGPAPVLGDLFF